MFVPHLGRQRIRMLVGALSRTWFRLEGLSNRQFPRRLVSLSSLPAKVFAHGSMTYRRQRPCLHGLVEHIPWMHRFRAMEAGLRADLWSHHNSVRILDHTLSPVFDPKSVQTMHLGTNLPAPESTIFWRHEVQLIHRARPDRRFRS